VDLNLRGRSALITGGSKGIGLAIARAPAAEGCHVQLCARTASELDKAADDIRGSGYVVASLEAALWCFATTDSFADAVLAAANLGNDADTTAAVCGQVAGAHHGASGIPAAWLERLAMRDEIAALADGLARGPRER
jgi:ADP-ribosylglycohydrolase